MNNRMYVRGWRDRMHGKDFPKAYDDWYHAAQISYERGRRAAAVAQAWNHNNPVPFEDFTLPLQIERAINKERTL